MPATPTLYALVDEQEVRNSYNQGGAKPRARAIAELALLTAGVSHAARER
jgi:hypothetical protein